MVACSGDDASPSVSASPVATADDSATQARTCILCTPPPGPIVRDGWRRFDADDEFSIEYPDGWTARNEEVLGDAWFSLPSEPVFIYIGFNRDPAVDASISVEELDRQQIAVIRSTVGVDAEVLEPAMLGDARASVIRYLEPGFAKEAVISATFIFADRKWVAQLHAPPGEIDAIEGTFRQMLASLDVHWSTGAEL